MPSTYSQDLRIELIANGEQSGTWGATTNINLGTLIEDAISGAVSITTNTQKYALLAADGAADQARCAALILNTTYVSSGNYEVYAPPVTKLYVIKNDSSTKDLDLYCGDNKNSTTVASGGVKYTIPMGKTAFVRSNGTSFFDAVDYISGNVSFTNATLTTPSLSGETFSTAATVSAAGTVQANGTALTADYNVVTTVAASSGVVLPTATVGRRIIIVNRGANTLNVYPFAGASQQIDALGANNPITIPINGVMMFNAATTSRWYSSSTLTLTNAVITTPSLVAATVSTTANVTAGSNAQGQSPLTSDYNVITTAASNPSGVTLPAATTGRKVLVVNKGANPVNVYPIGGVSAQIDALGINAAISLPANGVIEFNASSATQWYSSFNATLLANVGFTGTQPIASVNQVAVYGATGNSITTARTYQFRPTANSAGGAQLQLFEDPVNGANSITIQCPSALTNTATYTLPVELPTATGYVLSSTTAGALSWVAQSGGGGGGTITSVAAGNGMNFTTVNSGAATITMGTPLSITSSTSNSFSGSGHTHAITGAAFLASTQTFTGKNTISGANSGIISVAYNFTPQFESIYGSGTTTGGGATPVSGTVTMAAANIAVAQSSVVIAGNVYSFRPARNNDTTLGDSSFRWTEVFATNGTINTSDQNQKQDIAPLDDAEKRVATRIKGLIKKYRFKDAVAKKGDAARIHVGVIAQEVRDAFVAEGLDAHRYSLFCSDTWWEREEEEVYTSGGDTRPIMKTYKEPVEGATEVTQLGVRYDELLAFVIAAM